MRALAAKNDEIISVMSSTLYSNSSRSGSHQVSLSLHKKGDRIVAHCKGSPQYLLLMIFKGNKTKSLVAAPTVHIDGSYAATQDMCAYDPLIDLQRNFTYIFAVDSEKKIKIYEQLVPKTINKSKITIKINRTSRSDLFSMSLGDGVNIYNTSSKPLYAFDSNRTVTELPAQQVTTFRSMPSQFRESNSGPGCIKFYDLTELEQETYMPEDVLYGITLNKSTVYQKWVKIDDHLFKGTLTYCPTRDKEFHFTTDTGLKFRYTTEMLKFLIPHLVNGKIVGTFRYTVRQNNRVRALQYLPVPCDTQMVDDSDLLLCESSDSENEDGFFVE